MIKTNFESIDDSFVLGGIDLNSALDQIERDDGGVSDATWQQTANGAEGVVLRTPDLAWWGVVRSLVKKIFYD